MNTNVRNVFTLAQKEFADHLWNPVFMVMLAVFSLVIIACGYEYGVIEGVFIGTMTVITPGILMGMMMLSHNISLFIPLFGVALSFDALLKEERSGSLNVLMSHPLYRDNIIAGKMLGSMISLLFVLFISIVLAVGTLMLLIGESVTGSELVRIAAFFVVTYLYGTIFLGMGLLLSVLLKDPSDSLIYSIVLWLVFTVAFLSVLAAIVLMLGLSFEEDGTGLGLLTKLSYLSPTYHYQQLLFGVFDLDSTLSQAFMKFWMNLASLIVTPFLLFVASFIAFLRKDITI